MNPNDPAQLGAPHRVVIVGAGFGGLEAAKRLSDAPVDVTVIDRRNHHLFQPLLYQVATAGLSPGDIAYPIRSILGEQANTTVVLGEVVDVDLDDQAVTVADGERFPYDHLIVATGATHAYFGNDQWEQHAPGLKTVEDAIEIRRRILSAFERAERTTDEAERAANLTFVVVGAGPTGVELAGAIAEIATTTLAGDFRHIDPATTRVVLVEGAERVLTPFDASLSAKAERQLRALGVEVMTEAMVTAVDGSGVAISADGGDTRIEARTVLWGAGVAGSALGGALGADRDRAGRVHVGEDLAIAGHSEVFVIGDLAAATSDGEPVPGVAPAAVQGGNHAAACIRADLAQTSRPRFAYKDKGSLATIGRKAAVAEFGKLRFAGLPAWVLWWAVHIALLIGFRSRTLVMFSWGWSWLTFKRGARLITGAWAPRDKSSA